MNPKKKLATLGVGVAALTLAGASSALGLSHTVVTVGGNSSDSDIPVTGLDTAPIEFDTDWDIHTQCEDSSITGVVHQGTPVAVANTVGTITDLTFSDCEVDGGLPVVIELLDDAEMVVATHPANAGDPIAVRIEGVHAHMHSTGSAPWACEVHAEGYVEATINPGTGSPDGSVDINPGTFSLDLTALDGADNPANLENPSASGASCGGQIWTGDVATMTGEFDLDSTGAISHS